MDDQATHHEVILQAAKNLPPQLPWINALKLALQNGGDMKIAAEFLKENLELILADIRDFYQRTEEAALDSIAELEVGND
jgi:hypothetical protein